MKPRIIIEMMDGKVISVMSTIDIESMVVNYTVGNSERNIISLPEGDAMYYYPIVFHSGEDIIDYIFKKTND
jgi:hypothetical protein